MDLRAQQRDATAAHPSRDPPPHHQALPATHQRQGRALPPDDGARVGLRTRLPLPPRTRRRPATLAQPLQHDAATQLTRKPATDQPRSQPPWAGHLAAGLLLPPARERVERDGEEQDAAGDDEDGSRLVAENE